MAKVTKEAVLEALKRVRGPDLKADLVESGVVSDIFISGGKVIFSLTVAASAAQKLEPMRQAAEKVVSELPGVEKAIVSLTADVGGGPAMPPMPNGANGGSPIATAASGQPASGQPVPGQPAPGQPAGQRKTPPPGELAPPPPMAPKLGQSSAPPTPTAAGVPGVKHIIAVASGKGGVGKSTTTANLALALQTLGLSVGVMDADIYGPSQPRLLGVTGRPEPVHGRVLKPLEGYGLKVMSMGFLVEEDTPMIWRGPMVISAITQMLREVQWGDLDVLVVDMPPGTGDAQLTMAQQVPLSGAVIVSTPQDLALIDARKGINMFRKVDVPILGIIENMSYFLCPSCGDRSDIFGNGGARLEAEKIGVPFLGEVPLHMDIREKSDSGRPPVVSDPDGPHAEIFKAIAAQVWNEIQSEGALAPKAAPAIVME